MFLKKMLNGFYLILERETFIPTGIIKHITSFFLDSSLDTPAGRIVSKPFWISQLPIWTYLVLCRSIPHLLFYRFQHLFFVCLFVAVLCVYVCFLLILFSKNQKMRHLWNCNNRRHFCPHSLLFPSLYDSTFWYSGPRGSRLPFWAWWAWAEKYLIQ